MIPVLIISLASCASSVEEEAAGSAPTETVAERVDPTPMQLALVEEREDAVAELKGLRADVEERLNDVAQRLKRSDVSGETRKAVEDERTTLLDLRKRIDHSIEEVEWSDATTWQKIKERVNATSKDVRDWFVKMGDKVDQETKRDKDQDGQ